MAISDSEYLLLEHLAYMGEEFQKYTGLDIDLNNYTDVGQLMREVFTEETLRKLDKMGDMLLGGDQMSAGEWAAMLRQIKQNEALCALKIVDSVTNSSGKTFAICFEDPENPDKAVVAFRGTVNGEEWADNALGLCRADTRAQKEALDYIEGLKYNDITVIGHSKGGNKAQYVAILSDKVTKAISYDGQGFSQEFLDKYGPEIKKNAHIITCYSLDTDFVHILLYYLPGVDQHYVSHGSDVTGVGQNHSPDSFFQFYRAPDGSWHLRVKDGQPYLPSGPEDPSLTMLHNFTVFFLNIGSDEEKRLVSDYMAELLKMVFGQKEYSQEELKAYILSNPEALSTILAYLLRYMDTYGYDSKDIRKMLVAMGLDDFGGGMGTLVDFVLNQLRDNNDDKITRFLLNKKFGKYISKRDLNKIWSMTKKKYDTIGKVDPITATNPATISEGRTWDFSGTVYSELRAAMRSVADMLPSTTVISCNSGENWYAPVLSGKIVKGLDKYRDILQRISTESLRSMEDVFDHETASFSRAAGKVRQMNQTLSEKLPGFRSVTGSVTAAK